jgi:metal-dependent HD superfamily phosphatase/phosphodiesterase
MQWYSAVETLILLDVLAHRLHDLKADIHANKHHICGETYVTISTYIDRLLMSYARDYSTRLVQDMSRTRL